MDFILGNSGMCSLEISRTSKGDYTYSLKMYFSSKGKAPEAGIKRADKLRLDVERRLGLRPGEPGDEVIQTIGDKHETITQEEAKTQRKKAPKD